MAVLKLQGEGQQRAQLVPPISPAVFVPCSFWQYVAKLLSDMRSASLNSLRPHHHRRHLSTRSTFHWPALAWAIAPRTAPGPTWPGWVAFSYPCAHHGRRSKSRSINGQGILSTRPNTLTRHQTGITSGASERSSRLPCCNRPGRVRIGPTVGRQARQKMGAKGFSHGFCWR